MNVDELDESCLQEPQEWSDQQSEVRFYYECGVLQFVLFFN